MKYFQIFRIPILSLMWYVKTNEIHLLFRTLIVNRMMLDLAKAKKRLYSVLNKQRTKFSPVKIESN